MVSAGLCARGPLRRVSFIVTVAAAAAWCTASWSSDEEHRDHVRISGSPAHSVVAGHEFSFRPSASDSDHRSLSFAIEHKPGWASFDTKTGELSGKPATSNLGTFKDIVIAASDGWRSARLPAFDIEVQADPAKKPAPQPTPTPTPTPTPQAAPTISGNPVTTDVAGSAYAFQPTASGPAGLALAFSVQNKPAWATFSISTGLLSGTPSTAQAGTYSNIVLSVSDGKASAALPAFSITVQAPTTVQPAAGSAVVNWTPPSSNTNGTPLTNLAGIRIYYGTSAANLSQSVQLTAAQRSSTIPNLAAGVWYFAGAVYTTSGAVSALSNVVSASIQ